MGLIKDLDTAAQCAGEIADVILSGDDNKLVGVEGTISDLLHSFYRFSTEFVLHDELKVSASEDANRSLSLARAFGVSIEMLVRHNYMLKETLSRLSNEQVHTEYSHSLINYYAVNGVARRLAFLLRRMKEDGVLND